MVEVPCALRPAWVARVYLEAASVERHQVVHLVQLVDLRAELLCQVQIVRRHLVLGVAAAAVVAVAARDAAGAPRSEPAEVGIIGLDARGTEVNRQGGLVVGLLPADVVCDLLDGPVDVRGHVRVAHDAEHPPRLVEVRRQLIGPIGDAGPFLCFEELLRWDVHRARVDVRAASDAGAREDENVVEVLDPLDSVELQGGEPDEVRQVPLACRDLLVGPPQASLHHTDGVALLGGAECGNAAAETRADDCDVVVEARHRCSPSWGSPPGAGDRSRLWLLRLTVRRRVAPGQDPGVFTSGSGEHPGRWRSSSHEPPL